MSDPLATHERVAGFVQAQLEASSRGAAPLFAGLMVVQWLGGIMLAGLGPGHQLPAAIGLGALISSLPLLLALTRPTRLGTQVVVAVAQMLWGALLIHLGAGRFEPQLHLFASLAFVALYRDWRLVVLAAAVGAGALAALGPGDGALAQRAGWLGFEAVVLAAACLRSVREVRVIAEQRAEAELVAQSRQVVLLEQNAELAAAAARLQKLAEVGQLAASIGHELRNPISAVRNGLAYVSKRALDPKATPELLGSDPRVAQFLGLMDHELGVCSRMVSDLLDFARQRPPTLVPCPLSPLVDDAVSLIPIATHVKVRNEVPANLPIPLLDKEQFRQALINLIQNAVEAIPAGRQGSVVIRAEGGATTPLRITISDDGVGIPREAIPKIFQPLFTTKPKGTGLGLPIVAGMIQRHGGTISVTSDQGKGSTFQVELPPPLPQAA